MSDGTAAGTLQLADIAGNGGSAPASFMFVNNRVMCVATTDTHGRELYALNAAPTNLGLSNSFINENMPIGTAVGSLSATDPEGSAITFSLLSQMGDNDAFSIVSNSLRSSRVFNYEAKSLYNLVVRATDSQGAFTDQAFTVQVNNLAELGMPVQIGAGSASRSVVRQLVVDFDADVVVDAGAFLLQKRNLVGNNVVLDIVTTSLALSTLPSGATRATLTFSGSQTYTGGSLSDGFYQLTIFGANVRLRSNNQAFDGNGDGIAGGDYVLGAQPADSFFALFGDTNGDGLVASPSSVSSAVPLAKQLGTAGYSPLFDFDSDGAVGVADFGQFRSRFGSPRWSSSCSRYD